ncbi:MAG: dihydrodipicolinate synthase family protein [Clostridia bacterium]|nr:dihydrodipicolinate synthase family protein [Clostridia bacterium]MBN2882329.1 dihydrodipicolinate synthase family protein [Clostridia bacterium]
MKKTFKKGIFPTMVTPFATDGRIDYSDLEQFIKMLEDDGADGLFAVCQSSEMFFLDLKEQLELALFVKNNASIDVIASGHTQITQKEQLFAMKAMEQTGVDAVVLLSNAFAGKDESDDVMLSHLDGFLNNFKSEIPLGIYECPYPYKRLLSPQVLKYIIDSGRFTMMKDTSCDAGIIASRLNMIGDSDFGLYNANAQTLAYSTINGAAGFSGVHANISTRLVEFIMAHPIPMNNFQAEAHGLFYEFARFVNVSSYPVCAKMMLQRKGIFKNIQSRVIDSSQVDAGIFVEACRFLERIEEFEKQL